ncbi:MAG: hypothetical protein IPJ65_27180 [Archangiaceae bacterium]|nr:hypothetical protein [Archangiaceae bacterium]
MSEGARIFDVTFIDADSGQTFLRLKLPARQLPESFSPATLLNLGKDDWQVVTAQPESTQGLASGAAVVLTLRKVSAIDPRELLFSLPTVADEVPALTAEGRGEVLLQLTEDDWLQHELLPVELRARIDAELAAVREVLEHSRRGSGFERLHLRKALPRPFEGRALRVEALATRFGAPGVVAAQAGFFEHSFAFAVPGGVLYGEALEGAVRAMGLSSRAVEVAALCADERLLRVDWLLARAD